MDNSLMNKTKIKYLAIIIVAILASCLITHKVPDENFVQRSVFQYSTINALMQGVYDGEITVGELRKKGDFGIGTFNALDGEMIVYNGQFFKANSAGDIVQVADNDRSPFATVALFHADSIITFSNPMSLLKLQSLLDSVLPSSNIMYAIRVDATFDSIATRSVTLQSKPYRPLTEVVKTQSVMAYSNVSGTLIGFKLPDYLAGANVKGYHLHYLSADKKKGGHLLQAKLRSGRIIISYLYQYSLLLPTNESFLKTNLNIAPASVGFVENGDRK